jgi:hypothetical protein
LHNPSRNLWWYLSLQRREGRSTTLTVASYSMTRT